LNFINRFSKKKNSTIEFEVNFPVCVYKFSSYYLNNIIFYRQQFGSSSDRITLYKADYVSNTSADLISDVGHTFSIIHQYVYTTSRFTENR